MRVLVLLLILNSVNGLRCQTTLFAERILMDYKSASLTAENLKQIRDIWERLPVNASVELMLASTKEIKRLKPLKLVTLSKARADAIKSFLTTQKIVNINDIELNTHSFTEKEIIHGSSTTFNRTIRDPYKVYSLVLSKEVPLCYNYTTAERRALDSKTPLSFIISTNQDATITGTGGVIVQIPAHSFILPEGNSSADIRIKLWEFLTTEEILAANLYTTSSGKLLETGGMIYISADYQGTCLKLLRSSKIIIKFPTYEKLDGMCLFKGIPFPGIIDWKKTTAKDKTELPVDPEGISNPEGISASEGIYMPEGSRDSAYTDYYVLESSGLGWINCDRFYDVEEKIDIAFTCTGKFTGIAGLIFTGINSVMPGEFLPLKKNNVMFYNVPKGMDAVLLIYTISSDKKKISYATRKVKLGETLTETLELTETSVTEFKQILKSIKT